VGLDQAAHLVIPVAPVQHALGASVPKSALPAVSSRHLIEPCVGPSTATLLPELASVSPILLALLSPAKKNAPLITIQTRRTAAAKSHNIPAVCVTCASKHISSTCEKSARRGRSSSFSSSYTTRPSMCSPWCHVRCLHCITLHEISLAARDLQE
jgi:hypothetical protein